MGALARGLAAGAVGTGLMTAWQELSARLQSPKDDTGPEAEREPGDPWADASAPAKVAKRVSEGVFEKKVSAKRIPLLTNIMHWGYGSSWGTVYGMTAGSAPRPWGLRAGAAFGTTVWAMSYVTLVPLGLYEPPWKYPPKDLAMDLSYHVVYGAGVAAAFRALERQRWA
jgi:hypothetical protein